MTVNQSMVNFFCTYMPEEILIAAGLQPYRVIPFQSDPSLANTFLDSNFCPYVRSLLSWAIEFEKNKKILPTVIVNSCDGMRRLYDVWNHYFGHSFNAFLDLPRKRGFIAEVQYKSNLSFLKKKLEEYTGKEITDRDLCIGIQQCNEFRNLINRLDHLRRQQKIELSAHEFFQLVQKGAQNPKREYNQYLREVLNKCVERGVGMPQKRKNKNSLSILLSGTILDHLEIIAAIEEYGGFIDISDTCNGWRYYCDTIDENEADKMDAIARFYLNKIACPRMLDTEEREKRLLEIIKERKIDGVIFYTLKFCDTSLFQLPLLREKMKLMGIPSLYLEGDFSSNVSGQLKTRIQAFMEALEFD